MLKSLHIYAGHLRLCLLHQIKRSELPGSRFVIFGRERTGSTTLVSLMHSLPHVHCDGEILYDNVLFPKAHVLARTSISSAPTYGCKLLSFQIRDQQPIKDSNIFIRELSQHGYRIVYLVRENILEQSLSLIRGMAFGYHKKKNVEHKAEQLRVDTKELLRQMDRSRELGEFECRSLEGLDFTTVTYETDLLPEENHQNTVDNICNFLGIESAKVGTEYQKVSPQSLRDSLANYDEVEKALVGTDYERFLEK